MSYKGWQILFALLFTIVSSAQAGLFPKPEMIIALIVDQDNIPVSGANVSFSFRNYPQDDEFGVTTDDNGYAEVKKYGDQRVSILIEKEGFYYSEKVVEFDGKEKEKEQHNNIYKIVLKKKMNPVPMKAKHTRSTIIPVFDSPVGYDLELGDWVMPYGKGLIEDLVFNFHCDHETPGIFECTYKMIFSNDFDGIQPYSSEEGSSSLYRWPYEAPLGGYQSSLTGFRKRKRSGASYASENENMKYIFRVRTKVDEKGNIVDARYGKMDGDIEFYPSKIMFTYYFNPDGTPNLEFDPEQNLFKFSRREWRKHRVQRP